VRAALTEALQPVLDDLRNSRSVIPDVCDEQWSDYPGQVTAMMYGADGSGQGISVLAEVPLPERVRALADQIQDWAVEELWAADRPTNWPACPQHPDSHPLQAGLAEGRPVWCCPETDLVVGEIGHLQS
jgi:hypothetical protein